MPASGRKQLLLFFRLHSLGFGLPLAIQRLLSGDGALSTGGAVGVPVHSGTRQPLGVPSQTILCVCDSMVLLLAE